MTVPAKTLFLVLIVGLLLLSSCRPNQEPRGADARLQVTATIFPLYDFARNIGGDLVSVKMLLPPAADAHHYELRPDDIVRVSKTDIFLFTSFEMEPWAYKIINAAAEKTNMLALEAGQGTFLIPLSGERERHTDHPSSHPEDGNEQTAKFDPHIWLDFANAQKMVDTIAAAFINRDPANSETYKRNAQSYKNKLMDLDKEYREQLSKCKTRTILHAGHWAFAYLARRYHLEYTAAYNMSADAEPSPQQMMTMMDEVKKQKLSYIYYEDLTAPRLARTIAEETGAGLLRLNNGHDVSKADFQSGVSFIVLMERNLVHLKKGMQCR